MYCRFAYTNELSYYLGKVGGKKENEDLVQLGKANGQYNEFEDRRWWLDRCLCSEKS